MGDKGQFRAAPADHVTSYLLLPKHKHHLSGDKKRKKKKNLEELMNLLCWSSIGRCERFRQNEAPVDLGTAVHKQGQGKGGNRCSA